MLAGAVGADSLTNDFNITGQGVGLGLCVGHDHWNLNQDGEWFQGQVQSLDAENQLVPPLGGPPGPRYRLTTYQRQLNEEILAISRA